MKVSDLVPVLGCVTSYVIPESRVIYLCDVPFANVSILQGT